MRRRRLHTRLGLLGVACDQHLPMQTNHDEPRVRHPIYGLQPHQQLKETSPALTSQSTSGSLDSCHN